MSITLTGDGGLFTIFGQAFNAIDQLNTLVGTTFPPFTKAFQDEYKKKLDANQAFELAMGTVPQGELGWQQSDVIYTSAVQTALSSLLVEFVRADSPDLPSVDLSLAIEYLIRDMAEQAATVAENVVSIGAIVADANNYTLGDIAIFISDSDGQGRILQNLFAETIRIQSQQPSRTPSLLMKGGEGSSALSHRYPNGSGSSLQIGATDAASSLLTNGDFELVTNEIPNDWDLSKANPGTTALMTLPTVQTITISGTPTSGTYVLAVTNPYTGNEVNTRHLAFDAPSGDVLQAIQEIPDFESIAIETTGIGPDYVHAVTFNGLGGQVLAMKTVSFLFPGNVVVGVTEFGNTGSYRGLSLELAGDGAEVTEISHLLNLERDTLYGVHLRTYATPGATADLIVSVVSNGTTQASVTIPVADQGGGVEFFGSSHLFFRFPFDTIFPASLNIALGAANPVGESVVIDDVAVMQAQSLYSGGPLVAAYGGVMGTGEGDEWEAPVTVTTGGGHQTFFDRVFGMRGRGKLLPSSGAPTIPFP